MITVLSFLLFAQPSRVTLIDEVYDVPAREWRYHPVTLKRQGALIECSYNLESGSPVRVELLTDAQLHTRERGGDSGFLAVTGYAARGAFSEFTGAGDYAIVIASPSNAERASRVRLRIDVDFSGSVGPIARSLSPERRRNVVVISLLAFFAIVGVSARQLIRAMRSV